MMSNQDTASGEANGKCARLRVHSLTADVALLVWEDLAGDASGRRLCATIGGRRLEPPHAHVSVRRRSPHGLPDRRNIVVLRANAAAVRHERLSITQADGSLIAAADAVADADEPAGRALAFAPVDLIDGVDAQGRLRIARLMFEIVPDIFRLNDSIAFAADCRRLATALAPMPPALLPCTRLFGSYGLFAGVADAALGPKLNAVVISGAGLARAPFAPAFSEDAHEGEASRLWLVIREEDARNAAIVVVFSECGMICRRITAGNPRAPSAIEWLRGSGSLEVGAGGRRYILDCLASLGRRHAQAEALLRELQAMVSPARGSSMPLPVAAGADLIVASSAGVFVKGWLVDPQGLVEAICIEQPRSKRRMDIRSLVRVPRRNAPKQDALARNARQSARVASTLEGFAFFSANDAHAEGDEPSRITLSLCLRSGAVLAFAEGPSIMQAHAARDAVLAAIPPLYLTREIVADWIEPSVVALHEKDQKAAISAGSCTVIDIGCVPNSPDAALISPVPNDPLLMRYRAGLIAANPEIRSVAVVHTLERAQDRYEIESFLRGVHAAYGVAARLVVLPHPGTAARAFNAGARASRASLLVWLGAAVLPERPDWFAQLTGYLRRDANIGIVGARLLREDQALWNDGLDIGDNDLWDIRPIRAGFPRGLAPSQPVRHVTGVSPGCIAVRRSVLESCGGFSERYLTADYSVADLCLGAASAGSKICLTIQPTLFRLDPPGHERQGTEALDPTIEIDRRLLERRWRSRPELAAPVDGACDTEGARSAGAASAGARAA
ncbi:MAG: hypothetical protein ACXWVS_03625 [Hyphomicrobium sp.]